MRKLLLQNGFSIVELMVVTAITLFIMGGAFQMFKSAMMVSESTNLKSDADHNFRSAINLLTRDLMQAGQGIPIGGIPIPTGTGILSIKRPGPPGSNLFFPANLTTLPSVCPGATQGPTILGITTDMITILYADNTLPLSQTPLSAISVTGDSMTVDAGTSITGNNGIATGDLILFSNALGNAIQHVTATNGTQTVTMASSDSLNLNQRSASQGTILQLSSSGVFPPTTATRIWMISYYLDTTVDPQRPRLIRQVNNNLGRAAAIGIENLQLTYDLVDGATNPTNIQSPATPNQIRKANLSIAVRSNLAHSQTKEFFRNRLRTQISFRSLAFVDRYQ